MIKCEVAAAAFVTSDPCVLASVLRFTFTFTFDALAVCPARQGCSSMDGLWLENGPFRLAGSDDGITVNPYR